MILDFRFKIYEIALPWFAIMENEKSRENDFHGTWAKRDLSQPVRELLQTQLSWQDSFSHIFR